MNRISRLIFMGTAVLVLTGIALLSNKKDEDFKIPDPFKNVLNLDEAIKLAGFNFVAPETIGDFICALFEVIEGEMIQLKYVNDGGSVITVRKARGNDDVSGDYVHYPLSETLDFEGRKVTVKGDEKKVHVVTFTESEFTYAVQSDDGFDRKLLKTLLKNLY